MDKNDRKRRITKWLLVGNLTSHFLHFVLLVILAALESQIAYLFTPTPTSTFLFLVRGFISIMAIISYLSKRYIISLIFSILGISWFIFSLYVIEPSFFIALALYQMHHH